jgi:hypothetical protein
MLLEPKHRERSDRQDGDDNDAANESGLVSFGLYIIVNPVQIYVLILSPVTPIRIHEFIP